MDDRDRNDRGLLTFKCDELVEFLLVVRRHVLQALLRLGTDVLHGRLTRDSRLRNKPECVYWL